jgi:L-lactate dehydrogenase complex protein LldG
MTERERILGRIREALTVAAPRSGQAGHHASGVASAPDRTASLSGNARRWLPLVGQTVEERYALFRQQATDLKAEFHLAKGSGELAKLLVELRDLDGWKKVGSHRGELTDVACRALDLPVCHTDRQYDVRELESCDAGITECDALVAQTGSVLVTSRSAGGRALSVLPPHHVVLARREQMVGDLTEAFELLKKKYAAGYPSFISFITGPSRTGDIERILVLGAHGPKRLSILCY